MAKRAESRSGYPVNVVGAGLIGDIPVGGRRRPSRTTGHRRERDRAEIGRISGSVFPNVVRLSPSVLASLIASLTLAAVVRGHVVDGSGAGQRARPAWRISSFCTSMTRPVFGSTQ
jgi:hypothetical protein